MSFNIAELFKNNKATLTQQQDKFVMKISLDDLINALNESLDPKAKRYIKMRREGNDLVIEFDISILGNMMGAVPR